MRGFILITARAYLARRSSLPVAHPLEASLKLSVKPSSTTIFASELAPHADEHLKVDLKYSHFGDHPSRYLLVNFAVDATDSLVTLVITSSGDSPSILPTSLRLSMNNCFVAGIPIGRSFLRTRPYYRLHRQ
jgi:hypothetical protein